MRQIIHTENAPAAIGPYSQATMTDSLVFTSGQLGFDAQGQIPADIRAQTRNAMLNLGAILAEAGLGYENILKTTVFVQDLGDFAAVNEVYGSFFAVAPPARSCLEVARLPKDALVEIECIALR